MARIDLVAAVAVCDAQAVEVVGRANVVGGLASEHLPANVEVGRGELRQGEQSGGKKKRDLHVGDYSVD